MNVYIGAVCPLPCTLCVALSLVAFTSSLLRLHATPVWPDAQAEEIVSMHRVYSEVCLVCCAMVFCWLLL